MVDVSSFTIKISTKWRYCKYTIHGSSWILWLLGYNDLSVWCTVIVRTSVYTRGDTSSSEFSTVNRMVIFVGVRNQETSVQNHLTSLPPNFLRTSEGESNVFKKIQLEDPIFPLLRGSGYLGYVDNQGYNLYKWVICPQILGL